MKHIKTYKVFESIEQDYDIYDFFEELKHNSNGKSFDMSRVKKLSDRFIGEGVFERIYKMVDSILHSLEDVDINDVKEGMLDVFDEYHELESRVMLCMLCSDLDNVEKFNGMIAVGPNLDNNKPRMICIILRDIIYPTLFIGYPIINLRVQPSESLVTDKKYQCINFNIDDYTMSANVDKGIPTKDPDISGYKHTKFTNYDLDKKRNYDIEKFFEMYKPGIYISLGGFNNYEYKINLRKLESELDVTLPAALHNVNYEKIIWDASRFTRKFNDDTGVYDYTIKILLK